MIHEIAASGKMAIDGAPVKAGAVVASIDTEYPLHDILAGIRTGQFTVTQKAAPKTAPAPPPPEIETNTGAKPGMKK